MEGMVEMTQTKTMILDQKKKKNPSKQTKKKSQKKKKRKKKEKMEKKEKKIQDSPPPTSSCFLPIKSCHLGPLPNPSVGGMGQTPEEEVGTGMG